MSDKNIPPLEMCCTHIEKIAEQQDFRNNIIDILDNIENMLIEKNKSYGNAALNPLRVFSKASPIEQLKVRIDDKLSRIAKGNEFIGDDTINDLIGYLVLYKIATKDK